MGGTTAPAPEGDNAVGGSPGPAQEGGTSAGAAEEEEPSSKDERQREEEAFLDDNPAPSLHALVDLVRTPKLLHRRRFLDEHQVWPRHRQRERWRGGDTRTKRWSFCPSFSCRPPSAVFFGYGREQASLKKLEPEVGGQKLRKDRNTRQSHPLDQGDKRMPEMCGHLNVLVSEITRGVSSSNDDRR